MQAEHQIQTGHNGLSGGTAGEPAGDDGNRTASVDCRAERDLRGGRGVPADTTADNVRHSLTCEGARGVGSRGPLTARGPFLFVVFIVDYHTILFVLSVSL